MVDFTLNYNMCFSKPVILTIILCILSCFIFVVICSFYVLRALQISFDYNNIFFYQYNKKCKKIIDEYGDYKINRVYLIRQPFGKFVTLVFNILTLFNYNKYLLESADNFPYHPALIFEIQCGDNNRLLLVEKNNCINVCETFLINKTNDIKCINLTNKKYTIKGVLETTQKRIGDTKFFNWNIYKNNCQEFTKEILITLRKYNDKYKDFIFRDKIKDKITPSDFTIHLFNCLLIIVNFVEKYVYDSSIFN